MTLNPRSSTPRNLSETFSPVNLGLFERPLRYAEREWRSPHLLKLRKPLWRRRLLRCNHRLCHGVTEIGRDAGRERVRRFGEQPLELDVSAPPELVLLRCDAGAEVFQRLLRQVAVLRREGFEHVQVVEVAERLAKIIQRLGLRVQGFRPGAGQERELVAQINDAGAKGMQRNRIVALEGERSAFARLPISAGDRGGNVLSADRAQVPPLDTPDDRVEPRPWRGGREAAASAPGRLPLARDLGSGTGAQEVKNPPSSRRTLPMLSPFPTITTRAECLVGVRRCRSSLHPRLHDAVRTNRVLCVKSLFLALVISI